MDSRRGRSDGPGGAPGASPRALITRPAPGHATVTPRAARSAAPSFFQEYDLRGRFPEEIDPDAARRVGERLAGLIGRSIVVARDTREESLAFETALVEGLRARGATVETIGIAPTPAVEFCARRHRRFGLAVTPSHNPLGYVGLKGFTPEGRLLRNEWVRLARTWTSSPSNGRDSAPKVPKTGPRGYRPIGPRWREEYLRFAAGGVRTRLRVVVDCRGGATAKLAPQALRYAGASVSTMDAEYSSNFAGRSPEPNSRDLAELGRRVREERADLGVTFDGDGDRVVFVDEVGQSVVPEAVALVLRAPGTPRESPLVATADTSQRLRQFGRVRYCRVGSHHVRSKMQRTGALLGFEASGHYYFGDGTGGSDGIRTACLVLRSLSRRGARLGEEVARIGAFPRSARSVPFPSMDAARSAFEDCVRRVGPRGRRELDGLRISGAAGWLYLRASNTQPLLRVTLEPREPSGLAEVESWLETLLGLPLPPNG